MSQPIIEFGPKKYLLLDMLLYVFFNTLSAEDQTRFLNEYEVANEHGDYLKPASLRSLIYPPDITG